MALIATEASSLYEFHFHRIVPIHTPRPLRLSSLIEFSKLNCFSDFSTSSNYICWNMNYKKFWIYKTPCNCWQDCRVMDGFCLVAQGPASKCHQLWWALCKGRSPRSICKEILVSLVDGPLISFGEGFICEKQKLTSV